MCARGRPSRFVHRSALIASKARVLLAVGETPRDGRPLESNHRGGRLAKRHVGKTGGNALTHAGRTNTAKGKNPTSAARPARKRPGQAEQRLPRVAERCRAKEPAANDSRHR